MREFFDYNPNTGETEYLEFADGKFHITTEQDVQPYLDYAAELRNTQVTDGNFRKEGWLYAIIPPVVQAQMFKRGINLLDKNDAKKVVKDINQNYPWLKCTHRHHEVA